MKKIALLLCFVLVSACSENEDDMNQTPQVSRNSIIDALDCDSDFLFAYLDASTVVPRGEDTSRAHKACTKIFNNFKGYSCLVENSRNPNNVKADSYLYVETYTYYTKISATSALETCQKWQKWTMNSN